MHVCLALLYKRNGEPSALPQIISTQSNNPWISQARAVCICRGCCHMLLKISRMMDNAYKRALNAYDQLIVIFCVIFALLVIPRICFTGNANLTGTGDTFPHRSACRQPRALVPSKCLFKQVCQGLCKDDLMGPELITAQCRNYCSILPRVHEDQRSSFLEKSGSLLQGSASTSANGLKDRGW